MAFECDALSERFATMARSGVVDVKFCIRNSQEATVEVICEEITALLDAKERGDSKPLIFGDNMISA